MVTQIVVSMFPIVLSHFQIQLLGSGTRSSDRFVLLETFLFAPRFFSCKKVLLFFSADKELCL